jgi:CDP-diacylglycerol--glycerol-3-phosphate 3-phosphatidyltransferase
MGGRVYTLPMLLTVIRLFSPLVMPLLIIFLWPLENALPHVFLVVLFVLLGLTDVLDGYLARKFGEVTKLGQILDPIADKFLVISSLMALVTVGALHFFWVLVLVLREIFVMALRYIACEHGATIAVSSLSRIKTWLQLLLIIFLLSPLSLSTAISAQVVYWLLLIATIVCSLYAAYWYYMRCLDILFRTYDF